ncbi:MAG: hypothetical protein JST39_15430 [Bacteroidetes bacterium]|nr:hypothetical protein [Bacteroidota bacterium]
MEQHIIPTQQAGDQTDIVEQKQLPSEADAKALFIQARDRLLDVNHWEAISHGLSASFTLTDSFGNLKNSPPQPGDFLKIDIPGPGTSAGHGYDWVKVEAVEDYSAPDATQESIALRVRPSHDPRMDEGTAHFFDNKATSSFVVRRENNTVTAGIHGRNESSNTAAKSISDKLRNAVIKVAAAAGISAIQWKGLARGLVAQ